VSDDPRVVHDATEQRTGLVLVEEVNLLLQRTTENQLRNVCDDTRAYRVRREFRLRKIIAIHIKVSKIKISKIKVSKIKATSSKINMKINQCYCRTCYLLADDSQPNANGYGD
jgi:hypothetical protein